MFFTDESAVESVTDVSVVTGDDLDDDVMIDTCGHAPVNPLLSWNEVAPTPLISDAAFSYPSLCDGKCLKFNSSNPVCFPHKLAML